MRNLTLDEKISIKGKLVRKGVTGIPALTMENAVFYWNRCYGTSLSRYYLVSDFNTKAYNKSNK